MSTVNMVKNVRESEEAPPVVVEEAPPVVVEETPPMVVEETPPVIEPVVTTEPVVEDTVERKVESCQPSNWEILPVEGSEDITAFNTATKEEYSGSIEDFNKRLRA